MRRKNTKGEQEDDAEEQDGAERKVEKSAGEQAKRNDAEQRGGKRVEGGGWMGTTIAVNNS